MQSIARLMTFALLPVVAPAPTPTIADCVRVKFDGPEVLRHSALVFSGVVIKVDDVNDRLLFRVDRVWKGPARRETWIYLYDYPGVESHVFKADAAVKYLIAARTLSREERKVRDVADESPAFGISRGCGDGPLWSAESARELDRLASPKKPRK